MPSITSVFDKGGFTYTANCVLHAYMVFPDDEHSREDLYCTAQVERDLINSALPDDTVLPLRKRHLVAFRRTNLRYDEIQSLSYKGMTAGVLLQSLIVQENHQRDEPGSSRFPPSLKKSLDTLKETARVYRSNGKNVQYNSLDAQKAWQKFRMVSHLWASYFFLIDQMGIEKEIIELNSDELWLLLSLAKEILRRGRAIYPHGGTGKEKGKRSPVLGKEAFWFADDSPFNHSNAGEIVKRLRVASFEQLLDSYRYDTRHRATEESA